MIDSYNPLNPPNPEEWLAIDESERLHLVEEFVWENEPGIEGEMSHVALHVMIENQIALGDETPVKAVHERLMREGLDRHDSIHAIGTAFSEMLWENKGIPEQGAQEDFFERVEALTATKWLAMAEDEDGDEFDEIVGGLDEPMDSHPLSEEEILFTIESLIAREDSLARKELGLTITDSNIKSALRKAMGSLKGRPPKSGPKKQKPKDRWIAGLASDIREIGRVAATAGISRQQFLFALLKIEESLKTRNEMGGGSRGYLDFIHRFIEDGELH
jgi:hypothetical protein